MKYWFVLLLAVAAPALAHDIEQAAYFKDGDGNRIVVYAAEPDMDAEDIREETRQTPNTAGRSTVVFVYPSGDVPDLAAVTGAAHLEAAVAAMYDPAVAVWRWRYEITPDKGQIFTDCLADWQEALCPAKK
ncbi:MAG: hypothetical protein GY947_16960 [Rhodobacteraceae bacterium]|nr:hypothetical protein [Paracoccaceae bacterium]